MALADLGIGNGLINAVSATMAREDVAATRRAAASSITAVTLLAAALLLGLLGLAGTIDWAGLFNVTGTAAGPDAAPAAEIAARNPRRRRK